MYIVCEQTPHHQPFFTNLYKKLSKKKPFSVEQVFMILLILFVLLTITVIRRFKFDLIPWYLDPLYLLSLATRPFHTVFRLLFFLGFGFVTASGAALIFIAVVHAREPIVTDFLTSHTSQSLTGADVTKWTSLLGFLYIVFETCNPSATQPQNGQRLDPEYSGSSAWDLYCEIQDEKETLFWDFHRYRNLIDFFEDLGVTALMILANKAVTVGLVGAIEISRWWIVLTLALDLFFLQGADPFEAIITIVITATLVWVLKSIVWQLGWNFFNLKKHRSYVRNKVAIYKALQEAEAKAAGRPQ
jgi:hypothetical protein